MVNSAETLSAGPRPDESWLIHLARLVRWELFLIWRRVLFKSLLGALVGGYLLMLAFILLAYLSASASAALGQANSVRALLGFPLAIQVLAIYVSRLAPLLVCILAGAVVGGEYGFGTLRLVFTHGTSRAQLLLAQILALALLALGVVAAMLVLGALQGVAIGPLVGQMPAAVPAEGWGEMVLYGLALAAALLTYMLIALFMATLGRSVAAGIGLSLGVLFLEGIVTTVLVVLGTVMGSSGGQFLAHVPDWFPVNNTTALMDSVGAQPINFVPLDVTNLASRMGGIHALLVVIAYGAVLIGASYWLLRIRDVTD